MEDISLMVQIAKLYYEDGRTQQSIAVELGLTRLRVIELLKKTKNEGIVQIKIVDPSKDFVKLGKDIANKYGLKKVIVIPESIDRADQLKRNLGRAASAYLNETLKAGDILGVGWGFSVMETVNCLDNCEKRPITVIPLIGGGSETLPQYEVNEFIRKISIAFNGTSYLLYAPALVDNKKIKDSITTDSKIKRILDLWSKANVMLIGIGAMKTRMPYALSKYLETQPIDFEEQGIVGDILCRFYDICGNSINIEMHERFIGIDLNTLKNSDTVIGVAGGLAKFDAILGAIKGKVVNVLITDEVVARKLVMPNSGELEICV